MLSTYAKGLFIHDAPTWQVDSDTKRILIVGGGKITGKIPLYYFPAKISSEFSEQSVPRPIKDRLAIPYRKPKWGLKEPSPVMFGVNSIVFVANPELVIIKTETSGQKKGVEFRYPNQGRYDAVAVKAAEKIYHKRLAEQEFAFTRYFVFAKEDKWIRLKDNEETLDRITLALSIDTLTGIKHRKRCRIDYRYEYVWCSDPQGPGYGTEIITE
jgi:hypothetical protein